MRVMASYEQIQVTLPDGYVAYARYWSPPEPRGAVLYHHGIQSHCGWFEASAERLAEAGYAVLQVERRGCGRNEADRGHAESQEQLITDALAARDELTRRSGHTRHQVIGVSWGGKLAVAAFVTDPNGVAGLSLVTPGLFPLVGVTKEEMSRIGFAMIYEPERRFDIPLNEGTLFTADSRWREVIDTDPRTLQQCTAGFYLASRRMDRVVAKLPTCRPTPLHLMLARDERIIDNEKTVEFVNRLDWPDTRISWYESSRHSLEFDPDREAYFSDLVEFIRSNE